MNDLQTRLQNVVDRLRDELKRPNWEGSTVRELAQQILEVLNEEEDDE